ncbi:MAG: HAD-IIA family hydrolase [Actinomycetota bacterium]|nr:HAD-IIA family hydrolase [Actinomycetota bacterium]
MTTWALDLDGVLWTGAVGIPGSSKAVERLRAHGHEVVFVTNNSFSTIGEQEQKLAGFGIDAVGRVLNSALAGASLVDAGQRVFVLGGAGIREAVTLRGAIVITDLDTAPDSLDAVLVGLDWDLTYGRLSLAVQAVLAGARFVATNTDSTYPTERGLLPGAGALVGAVQAATGVVPTVAGKPEAPLADLVRARYGAVGIMVGDRADTDGAFAKTLGYEFGLVLSGVTRPADLPVDPTPDVIGTNLAELVDRLA